MSKRLWGYLAVVSSTVATSALLADPAWAEGLGEAKRRIGRSSSTSLIGGLCCLAVVVLIVVAVVIIAKRRGSGPR